MFKLIIATDNAAFCDPDTSEKSNTATRNTEVARILREAAALIDRGYFVGSLRDIDGNTVGNFEFKK